MVGYGTCLLISRALWTGMAVYGRHPMSVEEGLQSVKTMLGCSSLIRNVLRLPANRFS